MSIEGMKSFSSIVLRLVISGVLLGAGFTEGTVYILDSMSLENQIPEPFKYSRTSVTHISFSHDSQYMATAVSVPTGCCPVISTLVYNQKGGGLGRWGAQWGGWGVTASALRVLWGS